MKKYKISLQLGKKIARARKNRKLSQENLAEKANSYCRLLQEHIFKEDNILYPMAEEAIGEEQKKAIAKEFEKVNSEKSAIAKQQLNFIYDLE